MSDTTHTQTPCPQCNPINTTQRLWTEIADLQLEATHLSSLRKDTPEHTRSLNALLQATFLMTEKIDYHQIRLSPSSYSTLHLLNNELSQTLRNL